MRVPEGVKSRTKKLREVTVLEGDISTKIWPRQDVPVVLFLKNSSVPEIATKRISSN